MTTVNEYTLTCVTEGNIDKIVIRYDNEAAPNTCPTNTSHTIDPESVRITKTISNTVVDIREETTSTGGNIHRETIRVDAPMNSIASKIVTFPHPITALLVDFVSDSSHVGDTLDMSVGKNVIIGAITASVTPASAWVSGNYTVGQKVTYTHPVFGPRVYTCKLNTVSNEYPLNVTYWIHGFEVSVTNTVVGITMIGYYIKLDDGVNCDNCNKVLKVDKDNLKIYVQTNPTHSFSPASPTYVRQTVYPLKDYEIGPPWLYNIGSGKIGGSYIKEDTIITVEYNNKSLTTDKYLIGRLEMLY